VILFNVILSDPLTERVSRSDIPLETAFLHSEAIAESSRSPDFTGP
jgi:hypothetical protein